MDSERFFHIGGVVEEENQKKFLKIGQFIKALDDNINLTNYGSGITSIVYIPIGLPASDKFHPERIVYKNRHKKMDIRLKLDYQKLKNATDQEFLQMIADLFLFSIDRFKRHRVKNFDIPAFREDVKKVFRERNWI